MDQLLTLQQVAEYLNVSHKTVRRLVGRGALPCVRFGGVLRFQQADLVRFVSARKG
jgi:excisionase family DNA binding protein